MDPLTENLSDRMFIRLKPSTVRRLAIVAAEEERNPSEVARIAIDYYLAIRQYRREQQEAERALIGVSR